MMNIHTVRSAAVTALSAAAMAALFVGGPAAGAASAEPVPAEGTAYAPACPDIDVLTRSLRAAEFSDQAVKNYAELTRRDCASVQRAAVA